MKTAEEWNLEYTKICANDPAVHGQLLPNPKSVEFIRRIQADALLHASNHIYNKTADIMSMMRRPNCSEMAYDIQGMARQLFK